MTIEAAMLQAFLLLLAAVTIVSAVAAVLFVILTICFYVGGNAT